VGFDEDRAGEAEQRGGVGEDSADVGAAFDLLVQPLERYLESGQRGPYVVGALALWTCL
jgi:hypothetical protein